MAQSGSTTLRILLPLLAVTQAVAGSFHDVTGLGMAIGARSEQSETGAVPADYAFTIWGLIFLWSFAFAVYQALPAQRDSALLARVRGPAAATFAMNTVWQINAQLNRIEWLSFALIIVLLAAALASIAQLVRFNGPLSKLDRWLAAAPLHVLGGWLSVAVFAHLSSSIAATGGPELGLPETVRDVALVLSAAGIGAAIALRAVSPLPYGLAVIWGLGGVIAANIFRVPNAAIAIAAGVGILIVVTALFARGRQGRRIVAMHAARSQQLDATAS